MNSKQKAILKALDGTNTKEQKTEAEILKATEIEYDMFKREMYGLIEAGYVKYRTFNNELEQFIGTYKYWITPKGRRLIKDFDGFNSAVMNERIKQLERETEHLSDEVLELREIIQSMNKKFERIKPTI